MSNAQHSNAQQGTAQQERHIQRLGGTGILTLKDEQELSSAALRVVALMGDGDWHTADAIRRAAGKGGIPASEGLRRLRELRHLYDVEKKREGDSRQFLYRITLKVDKHVAGEQQGLF